MSFLIGWPIKNTLTPHGKKMHVKEIYAIFIHLFDSGIVLIIDLNKKKGGKGGLNFICELYSWINVMFRQFKEKLKICCD